MRCKTQRCTIQRCQVPRAAWVALLGLLTLGSFPVQSVQAQGAAAAARAFSNAQAAELAEDYGRAAELYELADRISPTREALRSAARMRKEAGDMAAAATHAEELLRRDPGNARSAELAEGILEEARGNLGRLEVQCEPRCELETDGFAVGVESRHEHVVYLEPGAHTLIASFPDGRIREKDVEAVASHEGQVRLAPPEGVEGEAAQDDGSSVQSGAVRGGADAGGSPDEGGGLHPAVFLSGLAVTLGLGATTVWSGIDTENLVDDYRTMPTDEIYDEGLDRQRRTNILAGVAGAAALATGLIGIFWTDWGGDAADEDRSAPAMRVTAGASHAGGSVALHGRF